MKQQPTIYACPPTQLNDQAELGFKMIIPEDGSITGNCALCGMQVWVGPKQQAKMKIVPGPVHCFKCVHATRKGHINIVALGKSGAGYIKQ